MAKTLIDLSDKTEIKKDNRTLKRSTPRGLLNAATKDGVTVLHSAIQSGSKKMVKLVLESKSAQIDYLTQSGVITKQEAAIEKKNFLMQTDAQKMNAMHYIQIALSQNLYADVVPIIEMLLEYKENWGADLFLTAKSRSGKTPSEMIVEEDSRRCKKIVNNDVLLGKIEGDSGRMLRRSEGSIGSLASLR